MDTFKVVLYGILIMNLIFSYRIMIHHNKSVLQGSVELILHLKGSLAAKKKLRHIIHGGDLGLNSS